jgi:hypothetical protein
MITNKFLFKFLTTHVFNENSSGKRIYPSITAVVHVSQATCTPFQYDSTGTF